MGQPIITILCEKPAWRGRIPALAATARRAAAAAYAAAGWSKKPVVGQFAICFSDDRRVRILNRNYRNKDKPTNVLSFAACDLGGVGGNLSPDRKICLLGDIVLAYETVRDEALAQGKPFAYHGLHLVVHGVLHLLGHDHQTPGQSRRMERLETGILDQFGIPDPYHRPRKR